jgi:hypothetical protein
MDLVSSAINFKQAQLASRVQYAVAAKILNQQEQVGASVLKLIDAAGKGVSQAGDALVASATGLGGSLDTYG